MSDKMTSEIIKEQEFSKDELASVDAIIDNYKAKPGALILVLEEIQEVIGYLPKSIQRRVALGLKIPFSEVYGVITFYSFFTMVPRGRHTIKCCMGTACYVRGGKRNLEKLTGILGIDSGNTTDDRRFSLDTVRCLGFCGLAPTMIINNNTYRQVKTTKIPDILEDYD